MLGPREREENGNQKRWGAPECLVGPADWTLVSHQTGVRGRFSEGAGGMLVDRVAAGRPIDWVQARSETTSCGTAVSRLSVALANQP